MSKQHEAVDEVGPHKTRTTCDKDTFPHRGRKQFYRRESRQSGIRDGMRVWVEDSL